MSRMPSTGGERPAFTTIITFTIPKAAHAPEVSADHVTPAVYAPSATPTVTPTTSASSLRSTCLPATLLKLQPFKALPARLHKSSNGPSEGVSRSR